MATLDEAGLTGHSPRPKGAYRTAGNRAERRIRESVGQGLHIAVVVPCYNTEQQIRSVVAGIPGFVRTVVLVDDGSTDGTAAVLASLADGRVRTIRLLTNQGVGAAMLAGFAEALVPQLMPLPFPGRIHHGDRRERPRSE